MLVREVVIKDIMGLRMLSIVIEVSHQGSRRAVGDVLDLLGRRCWLKGNRLLAFKIDIETLNRRFLVIS